MLTLGMLESPQQATYGSAPISGSHSSQRIPFFFKALSVVIPHVRHTNLCGCPQRHMKAGALSFWGDVW